jgi:pre-rRNA-processing protein IPI3
VLLILFVEKTPEAFFSYDTEELMQDYSLFVQNPVSGGQASSMSLQSRVVELESEVQKLRDQLGKAKSINDSIWDTVVRKVILGSQDKEKNGVDSAMDVDENGSGSNKKQRAR